MIPADHVAVIGHSRLGKTALWTAALDERFWAAVSNNSGFGGAALSRAPADPLYGKMGEKVNDFIRAGSWDWYCETFKEYEWREHERPCDQHFLLAMIAPRLISVASAENDRGADPQLEYLSCRAASAAYEVLGLSGLVAPNRYPQVGESFHVDEIGYHLRAGEHFLSRADWIEHIAFLQQHLRDSRSRLPWAST